MYKTLISAVVVYADIRLVLASHNYSGKLSGCRPQCFTGGTCADHDTTQSLLCM